MTNITHSTKFDLGDQVWALDIEYNYKEVSNCKHCGQVIAKPVTEIFSGVIDTIELRKEPEIGLTVLYIIIVDNKTMTRGAEEFPVLGRADELLTFATKKEVKEAKRKYDLENNLGENE